MKNLQIIRAINTFVLVSVLLFTVVNIPILHAEELVVESPSLAILDNTRVASNAAWIAGSSFDIRTTHDQSISVLFGVTGGILLFVGIMIILYFVKRFFQNRYLMRVWSPLRLVVW